jgi:glycosyltransferase involved in cell wall biosynthesis
VYKVRVLHFVSQPGILKQTSELGLTHYIEDSFFYMPNQFWEHKNHLTVFKAVKLLKDEGFKIRLLTSGLMHDFRNKSKYVEELRNYVVENELSNDIKFLGLIPYGDVLGLIKKSLAVINPSFFEGWSSTVEEAKSIGKPIILSDIPVHREQNPLNGFYFNPNDEKDISNVMKSFLIYYINSIKIPEEKDLMSNLKQRTFEFASNYKKILDYSIISKIR